MQIFAITVLGLEILCLLASFTHGEVDHFKMDLVEKGTSYSEEIDVDEENDVEVFRVPAHNDVEGADFYHDFKMRVTVTRIPSRKVCYISKLDSAMSSPGKLKADHDRAASQTGTRTLPEETDSTLVIVTGPANRLRLTKGILDFCGALPIYNTEHTKVDPGNGNGTAIIRKRRQKRDRVIESYTSCLKTLGGGIFDYVKRDGCNDPDIAWDIECQMKRRLMTCFHYVTCTNLAPAKMSWNCTSVHRSSQSPICCDFICPT